MFSMSNVHLKFSPENGTKVRLHANVTMYEKKGQVQFRTDKGGILHCIIGKLSFQSDDLLENMKELIGVVSKLRPASAKGIFLKKISLSSTMGPGLTVDVNFFK